MGKAGAIAGSAIFFFIAPGTVAGLGPWLITDWRLPAHQSWMQVAGAAIMFAAALALIECFLRFALEGEGTPAPVAPTKRLVVRGLYRHVRNPMYVCVVALILGQALLFEVIDVAAYGAAAWLFFHLFVVLFEERRLRREFGEDYIRYLRNVPRWLPRITPWTSSEDGRRKRRDGKIARKN